MIGTSGEVLKYGRIAKTQSTEGGRPPAVVAAQTSSSEVGSIRLGFCVGEASVGCWQVDAADEAAALSDIPEMAMGAEPIGLYRCRRRV